MAALRERLKAVIGGAGSKGAGGSAISSDELGGPRSAKFGHVSPDRAPLRQGSRSRQLHDNPCAAQRAWLAGPPPETETDRAIREQGERLREAFPAVDFDDPNRHAR